MPQAKLPTAGTHNLQDRFAETIVKLKRKQNVVRNFFHNDYMGEPKSGSVKIAMRPLEVVVGDYNVQTGATLTFSTTDYMPVLVSKNKAVNELIDGYEASAVPDNVVAQRLDSGAYSLGRRQELDAIDVLVNGGTVETSTVASADSTIYSNIVGTIARIKKLGVPVEELVIVISVDTETLLLTDTKYSNTASTIGAELVREGIVSKIAGAPVVVSTNLPTGVEYLVFGRSWAGKVEDWVVAPTINNLYDGAHIGASALQGRMVYQDVLTDPTTCRIKRALDVSAHLAELIAGFTFTTLSLATRTLTVVHTYTTINVALAGYMVDGRILTDKVLPNGTYVSALTYEVGSGGAASLTPTNVHLGGRMSFYLSELFTDASRTAVTGNADSVITITATLKTPQAVKLTATVQNVISADDFKTVFVVAEKSIALDIDAE